MLLRNSTFTMGERQIHMSNVGAGGGHCTFRLEFELPVPIPYYKIQHLFMIKTLRRPDIEGNVLNLKNGI